MPPLEKGAIYWTICDASTLCTLSGVVVTPDREPQPSPHRRGWADSPTGDRRVVVRRWCGRCQWLHLRGGQWELRGAEFPVDRCRTGTWWNGVGAWRNVPKRCDAVRIFLMQMLYIVYGLCMVLSICWAFLGWLGTQWCITDRGEHRIILIPSHHTS